MLQNILYGFAECRNVAEAQRMSHATQHSSLVRAHEHIDPNAVLVFGIHPVRLAKTILQVSDIPVEDGLEYAIL